MTKTEDLPQPSVRTVEDRIEELRKRRAALLDGTRRDAVRKQHEKGKLTARERVELLVDRDSFQETDPFAVHRSHDFGIERNRPAGDGVITGYGTRGREANRIATDSRCASRPSARASSIAAGPSVSRAALSSRRMDVRFM